MSLRQRNSQSQARHPNPPTTTAVASRLDRVLQIGLSVGAKDFDNEGNVVRKVKFEPGDPKTEYKKDCLQVPWQFIDKYPSRITEYVYDVASDPRINEIADLPQELETQGAPQSNVQKQEVQDYVNQTQPASSEPEGEKTWVVSWNPEYSRFCLVPISSISLIERLEQAIRLLKNNMDDDALTWWYQKRNEAKFEEDDNTDTFPVPMDVKTRRFRDNYVQRFERIVGVINDAFALERTKEEQRENKRIRKRTQKKQKK